VLLPAGDGFNMSKWLDKPHMANWDLGAGQAVAWRQP
jgi:hypothetical protein